MLVGPLQSRKGTRCTRRASNSQELAVVTSGLKDPLCTGARARIQTGTAVLMSLSRHCPYWIASHRGSAPCSLSHSPWSARACGLETETECRGDMSPVSTHFKPFKPTKKEVLRPKPWASASNIHSSFIRMRPGVAAMELNHIVASHCAISGCWKYI